MFNLTEMKILHFVQDDILSDSSLIAHNDNYLVFLQSVILIHIIIFIYSI